MVDLLLSLPAIVLAAAPMAMVALLILVFDGRPILFRQERIGQWGKRFVLLKFRSMNADNIPGSSVTIAGDSRVTAVGRWLRRWKLDELPQLLNVVRGDMSLVGPRPDVPGYWDCLGEQDRPLLALRPGITGPGTLVFRREEEMLAGSENPDEVNDREIFPRKVHLARRYAGEISLLSDLKWIVYTSLPEPVLSSRLESSGWAVRLDHGSP